ncbi:MAG TPA: glycosyltransferase family 4 protein [Phycisphaerae bacterium]|nr:glycosyltransferase family 4 protein [Phycisphaerae bacterium]
MPLRIALLSWESRHANACGGLAEHVSELASALYRRGHDVHVFTRAAPEQPRYDCIAGVHYHRCQFDPHPNFITSMEHMSKSLIARLVEAERFYGRPFDVVHGHDWLVAKGLIQAKNDHHRPTVLTMHSTEFGRCGNQLVNGDSRRIRDVEWEGTYVANRVICVSRALREEVWRLYSVPEQKTHVIYNGVDFHRFDLPINTSQVRSHWGIPKRDRLVLFAGRLAWQKGPDVLVEAIPSVQHHNSNVKFVFVGDGHMRTALEHRVTRLGLFDTTRFLGHRSGDELVGLFRAADILCVPSRNEPFGIVILEAWSASKPVVVTQNGGPGEFVRHMDTGLITADNPDSIAWGIATALDDRPMAKRLGRNGRKEVEARFAWDRIAQDTEQVYASL